VVLPRLESDFVALALAAAKGGLASFPDLRWSARPCVGVVVASGGYPDDAVMKTGYPIRGLAEMPKGVLIFHAGTRREGNEVLTSGGRVLCAVGLGDGVAAAQDAAYALARTVQWPGVHYRHDIGARALGRAP